MRPLFVFSLPRSGSTLVQRVLGAHPDVATTAEPWVLLPLLYATRPEGVRAVYWHRAASEAIGDFVAGMEGGRAGWHAEVREFATALYRRAGGAERAYFLDKTPRYHSVAAEIMELFPDGRFVFLWRQPLAVLASCLDTFRAGRFEPYHFDADLYGGLEGLVEAYGRADGRAHAVRYEDLAGGGAEAWLSLHEFLGLEFDPAVLDRPAPDRPAGRYGDPTGARRYATVDAEPVARWPRSLAGPVRAAWCRRYLGWVGEERMRLMGYDLSETLAQLRRRGGSPADAARLVASRRAARGRAAALRLPEGPEPLGPAFEPGS